MIEKIGEEFVPAVHFHGFRPFRNFAGGDLFKNQRAKYQSFKEFIRDMLSKYDKSHPSNEKLEDPRDACNIIDGMEIPDALKDDIEEPGVIKIALNHKKTTLNMKSQGTMTLTQTKKDDLLHCVVAGQGEKISMVSPYQRLNIEAGLPYSFFNEAK